MEIVCNKITTTGKLNGFWIYQSANDKIVRFLDMNKIDNSEVVGIEFELQIGGRRDRIIFNEMKKSNTQNIVYTRKAIGPISFI